MTTVAIICGYDLDSDLREYIADVTEKIHGERLDAVVLSGGRTHPRFTDSEAAAMAEHLSPHHCVLLDHEAMTTLDNIVFGRLLAERTFPHVERWVVCCDVAHVVKVWLLARIVLRGRIAMRVVHRPVPLYIWMREPLSILIEVGGALIPSLRPVIRAAAARMKGVSAKQRRSVRPATALAVVPPDSPPHTSGIEDRSALPAPAPQP
ncbi:MAG TPA: ElyC/SanA/YdcF family protein [Thermoanaerobaculia bacterium]|nr:ElyC/SanA/YdcF family protein [Thermoanaerobaculia bacterium]